MRQEIRWFENRSNETFSSTEVAHVVRDDGITPGRYRHFNDHVVIRVLQQWTPKIEDTLAYRDEAQVVHERSRIGRVERRSEVSKQHRLILEHQGNRHRDFKGFIPEVFEQSKRSARA